MRIKGIFVRNQPMNRQKAIQLLIDRLHARYYLEIGVFDGRCFMEIRAPYKVAVDPDMKITFRYKLHAIRKRVENLRNQYKHLTSDAYFASLQSSSPGRLFDVIFIDGLHTYSQTFIDIIHSLQFLNPKGAIVLHDINPDTEALALPASSRSAAMQAVGKSGGWCGDSWKAFHHLIACNRILNQLDLFTLNCDFGLGVIFPKEEFNRNDWKGFSPESHYENLPYEVLDRNRADVIKLVEPDFINQYLNSKQLKSV